MEERMQNLSLQKSLTTVYPETGIQDKSYIWDIKVHHSMWCLTPFEILKNNWENLEERCDLG